jgi:predicted NBD/HSP70 family sugar kinase
VAECVDAYGETIARTERPIGRPARPAHVADVLRAAIADARQAARLPLRLAVVSAADPVDRESGRMIQLPDAPFLLGELDPVEILAPMVSGPITVDNDVNWAAQAEKPATADFAYVFLGEGLGCAIISDGEIRRGRHGLAGEIAHLVTTGAEGRATPLIEVFGQLGLRREGSTAIDVDRLIAVAGSPAGAALRGQLGRAVGGVVAAVTALADPAEVIVGGAWGSHPAVLKAIIAEVAGLTRAVPVRAATVTVEPSLVGARLAAVEALRAAILARSQDRNSEEVVTVG